MLFKKLRPGPWTELRFVNKTFRLSGSRSLWISHDLMVSGMHGTEGTSDWDHDGRWIELQPQQLYDYTWECVYIIFEIGPTHSTSIKRNMSHSFTTREEAEAAAMDAAQVEIDSRGPLS